MKHMLDSIQINADEVKDVLDKVEPGLDDEDLADVQEYIAVGEYGLALDLIYAVLEKSVK